MTFKIDLGKRFGGERAGELRINTEEPTVELATTASLFYSMDEDYVAGEVEVIRDSNDLLRQVKTPMVLVDIVTISAYKYEIRMYDSE